MSRAGVKLRRFWRAMSFGILLLVHAALTSCAPTDTAIAAPDPGQVTIKVTNLDPKVKTVIARVKETREVAILDQGKLTLQACGNGHTVSVWAPGYSINSFQCNGSLPAYYEIPLERLNAQDNPSYPWGSAVPRSNSIPGCANCHSDGDLLNEYPEWETDGHSRAFVSQLFWTTYLGTNVNGLPGQRTQWAFSPDGSRYRLPPIQPDYGPGYQLDYPDSNGNCAFCHVPAAIGATDQEVNLAPFISASWGERVNVASEGVTCDICHKVIDVALDERQLPHTDRPGILSFTILRPAPDAQFFAGPWSQLGTVTGDTTTKRTCAPVFSESGFCAPCHYAKFSGVEIYASYKEWLDSPYSQPNQGFRSCQDCHMAALQPVGGTSPQARSACAPENTSFRNFNHNMMKRDNTGDPILIQRAATVNIGAMKEAGKVRVNINVVNTGAGHKLPTDSPLRHLILVVEARDQNGLLLSQVDGPTIPDWGGTENGPYDYAGQPGVIYANILKDNDTSRVPTVAYWNPTSPAWQGSDTRLLPNQDTPSQYFFVAPSQGEVTITARLFYRYAFIDIIRRKGLQPDDILVNWAAATVP